MSDADRVRAYLQLAAEELTAARTLATGSPRQAVYYLQQSVEKIARAVLAHEGVDFGIGHNLARMAHALPDGHSWREKIAAFDHLSPASTRYRYPGPTGRLSPPPPRSHLERDIDAIGRALEEAREFVGT
jgi:HEPN domain-containing protein